MSSGSSLGLRSGEQVSSLRPPELNCTLPETPSTVPRDPCHYTSTPSFSRSRWRKKNRDWIQNTVSYYTILYHTILYCTEACTVLDIVLYCTNYCTVSCTVLDSRVVVEIFTRACAVVCLSEKVWMIKRLAAERRVQQRANLPLAPIIIPRSHPHHTTNGHSLHLVFGQFGLEQVKQTRLLVIDDFRFNTSTLIKMHRAPAVYYRSVLDLSKS